MTNAKGRLYDEAKDLYARLKPEEVLEYTFSLAYVANHNSEETVERLGRIEKALLAIGLPAIGALAVIAINMLFGPRG